MVLTVQPFADDAFPSTIIGKALHAERIIAACVLLLCDGYMLQSEAKRTEQVDQIMFHRSREDSKREGHGKGDLFDGIDDGGIIHSHYYLVVDPQNGTSGGDFHSIVIVVDARDTNEKSIDVVFTASESDAERWRHKRDNDGGHDRWVRRGLKGRLERVRESSLRNGHEGFMATVAELFLYSLNEVDRGRVLRMRHR